MQEKTPNIQNRIRINWQIKVPQVRVVLEDGSSPGVMLTHQALQMAKDAGLDLVEINAKVSPPICKIIDYGKFKYNEKKRLSEIKENLKQIEIKEIRFRPNIDIHDLNHKISQARGFLEDGNHVKFTIKHYGREITHPELAKEKLQIVIEQLSKLSPKVSQIQMEGKIIHMTISPK
jgi:translation initiation factor IF-3